MKAAAFLLLISLGAVTSSYAQKSHAPVLLGDTSKMVYYQPAVNVFGDDLFPGTTIKQSDSFERAYRRLVRTFGSYQKGSGMKTGHTLKAWWKVYFDKSGSIDGMIFRIVSPDVSDGVAEQIYERTRKLIKNEKIPLRSIYSFSQCGSIKVIIP